MPDAEKSTSRDRKNIRAKDSERSASRETFGEKYFENVNAVNSNVYVDAAIYTENAITSFSPSCFIRNIKKIIACQKYTDNRNLKSIVTRRLDHRVALFELVADGVRQR